MAKHVTDRKARKGESDSLPETVATWNTTRADAHGQMSYTARTTLSFAFTAIMTVLLLVLLLATVWEQQFTTYTRSNMERLAQSTAESVAVDYEQEGGWTTGVLDVAKQATSSSTDVGVQVIDVDGTVLYDNTWTVDEDAKTAADSVPTKSESSHRVSLAPTSDESTVQATIVTSDGETVGTVRMWAFGSEALLTTTDATFRDNSYRAIFIAAIIAVALATMIGALVARSLARPIKRITSTAQQIRNGDLTARTGVRGEDEIGQLGETFDDMATSLERDLKLEHRLTSDVAHELRTPLMAMLATVEAMQDGVLPCDEERLGVVAGEVQRLSRLVDAMLQLSRMENGTTAFDPVPTDVVALAHALVSSQEQLFADNDLELAFVADGTNEKTGNEPEIQATVDRDMMNQAVTNLLSNAMRYTAAGGHVEVRVAQDRGDVLISVADTGMGIAREDLSRVFGRFWRSESSRERASGGLGVGLAVTKQIVDRHHGFISVESEEGVGTTFVLHIPKEYRATQPKRRPSATMGG